jgi:hypothetical protein
MGPCQEDTLLQALSWAGLSHLAEISWVLHKAMLYLNMGEPGKNGIDLLRVPEPQPSPCSPAFVYLPPCHNLCLLPLLQALIDVLPISVALEPVRTS